MKNGKPEKVTARRAKICALHDIANRLEEIVEHRICDRNWKKKDLDRYFDQISRVARSARAKATKLGNGGDK